MLSEGGRQGTREDDWLGFILSLCYFTLSSSTYCAPCHLFFVVVQLFSRSVAQLCFFFCSRTHTHSQSQSQTPNQYVNMYAQCHHLLTFNHTNLLTIGHCIRFHSDRVHFCIMYDIHGINASRSLMLSTKLQRRQDRLWFCCTNCFLRACRFARNEVNKRANCFRCCSQYTIFSIEIKSDEWSHRQRGYVHWTYQIPNRMKICLCLSRVRNMYGYLSRAFLDFSSCLCIFWNPIPIPFESMLYINFPLDSLFCRLVANAYYCARTYKCSLGVVLRLLPNCSNKIPKMSASLVRIPQYILIHTKFEQWRVFVGEMGYSASI